MMADDTGAKLPDPGPPREGLPALEVRFPKLEGPPIGLDEEIVYHFGEDYTVTHVTRRPARRVPADPCGFQPVGRCVTYTYSPDGSFCAVKRDAV
jgi:hypothetical protein